MEPVLNLNQYGGYSSSFKEEDRPYWDLAERIVQFASYPLSLLFRPRQLDENKNIPPSAPGHPLTGNIPEFWSITDDTLIEFLASYHKEYGEQEGISEIKLATKSFYIVTNPELIQAVFEYSESFVRGPSLKIWEEFFSKGGLKEGTDTIKNRKQAFNVIALFKSQKKAITHIAELWIKRLSTYAEHRENFNIFEEAERAILAVMSACLFKRDPSDPNESNPFGVEPQKDNDCKKFLKAYHDIFEVLSRAFTSKLPFISIKLYKYWNPEEVKIIEESKAVLNELLTPIFEDLLLDPNRYSPYLEQIVHHFEINTRKLDIEDLIEKSLGFLHGAFGTTSKSLGWTLLLLGKKPEIQKKLQASLEGVDLEDVENVSYLKEVVLESLRLFPPFPILTRDVVDPEKFPHYHVKKGGTLILSPLLVHHNAHNWPDPTQFIPERFADQNLATVKKSYKLIPFLGGTHVCPGQDLAFLEERIFLAHFFKNFSLHLVDRDAPITFKFSITLPPKTVHFGKINHRDH